MNDEQIINKISLNIKGCVRSVNSLKNTIDLMIDDESISNTSSNTIEKSLTFIDNNINTLENTFFIADSLSSTNKYIRKQYVLLIESTINDMKNFRQKLEKIKTYNDDIGALSEYLKTTTI